MHRLSDSWGNDTEVPDWVKGANWGNCHQYSQWGVGIYSLCMLITFQFLEKSWKSCWKADSDSAVLG